MRRFNNHGQMVLAAGVYLVTGLVVFTGELSVMALALTLGKLALLAGLTCLFVACLAPPPPLIVDSRQREAVDGMRIQARMASHAGAGVVAEPATAGWYGTGRPDLRAVDTPTPTSCEEIREAVARRETQAG